MKQTLVVVPCYNEAGRLDAGRFREFVAQQEKTAFLFVDDGSRDATPDVLRQLEKQCPDHIRVLTLGQNRGKAEAVRRGMLLGDQWGAKLVGFWDADLATPLEAIPQFCQLLLQRRDMQIAWGTRLNLLGRQINRHQMRSMLGRFSSRAAALSVGLPIHDATCGAKMFRSGPLLRALFATPFDSRWIFDVEILARLQAIRRRQPAISVNRTLFEVPLDVWHEIPGSRLKMSDFMRAVYELAKLFWNYRLRRSDLAHCGDNYLVVDPKIISPSTAADSESSKVFISKKVA